MGYTTHVSHRVARAKSALTRLYRFRDLATGLKLHLIKALIIPILSYPPVPLHALSRTAISRLQRVQNSALRFAFGTRWDDFTSSASLHEAASLPALNVRLQEMAAKLWQRMDDEGWDQYRALRALHEETPHRQHAWFPRSLLKLEEEPPEPRYRSLPITGMLAPYHPRIADADGQRAAIPLRETPETQSQTTAMQHPVD
ncbi:uncharacterized protein LOC123509545 [Portunus trituberculatus]|uniref:uncharacterized protein LOC123509545 n=1 Tax=Portunus trituberculatus TaxID=210409 RepID=UPI001E1CB6D8|nr:uncharacterized protein LOC123509545 [Portunus trituberculatus]